MQGKNVYFLHLYTLISEPGLASKLFVMSQTMLVDGRFKSGDLSERSASKNSHTLISHTSFYSSLNLKM